MNYLQFKQLITQQKVIKEIPLPEHTTIYTKPDGLPLCHLNIGKVKKRTLLSIILISSEDYMPYLFIVDISEITRKGSLSFVKIFKGRKDIEEIYNIYSFNKGESYGIVLVTNCSIRAFMRQNEAVITFDSSKNEEIMSRQPWVVYPSLHPELSYRFSYEEVPTIYNPKINSKSDYLFSSPSNLSLQIKNYVSGYEMNYTTDSSPQCAFSVLPTLETLGELAYGFQQRMFIKTAGEHLYLYSVLGEMLRFEYSYKNPYRILSSQYVTLNFLDKICTTAFEILSTKNNTFFCYANTAIGKGQAELNILANSGTFLFREKILSKAQTRIYKSERYQIFVFVHVMFDSFIAEVLFPYDQWVINYKFTSNDLGLELGKAYSCELSKTERIMYCLHTRGIIYTIGLGTERARLLSVTNIYQFFEQFRYDNPYLIAANLISTHHNEIFINTLFGIIRCKATTHIDCLRTKSPKVLNIIPNFNDAAKTFARVRTQDERVLILLNSNKKFHGHRSIRIIDLLSDFENTEVRDVILPDSGEVTSIFF